MSKSVLVTGAAGFIGSHTVEQLVRRGDKVVGLDNFNDYYDPNRKRANVAEVQSQCSFELVDGDIRDDALLGRLFDEHRFDAVVHLAAMAGVRASAAEPAYYYDVNLTGSLRLLEQARHHDVDNVVFASTSSAYGRTEQIPFLETDPCNSPLAPYPASKRAVELLGHSYHHLHGLSFTALRFFTVYGPRGRPDMMPYKVLRSACFGDRIPYYRGGDMHRDWTYVGDIVQGIALAVDRPLGFEVVNLGRGEPVKVADFVEALIELSGRRPNLHVEPMPAADVPFTFADLTKARTLLGYQPSVSVREGTQRFWAWFERVVLAPGESLAASLGGSSGSLAQRE